MAVAESPSSLWSLAGLPPRPAQVSDCEPVTVVDPISPGSATILWDRLQTHRGAFRGTYGANHRGSIFRERAGKALIERHGLHDDYSEWGQGSSAGRGAPRQHRAESECRGIQDAAGGSHT
ncbi:hypothetical protein ACOZ4L_14130 [Haloplanus ruber]|uniref:GIY-YIG domain-containing protein n=1 Tax=Haloplanus ruber TaxID=869892 RepID=A0ABD6CYJ2_9EURY|nr:hypothetical protein [Haloplanus ruber]